MFWPVSPHQEPQSGGGGTWGWGIGSSWCSTANRTVMVSKGSWQIYWDKIPAWIYPEFLGLVLRSNAVICEINNCHFPDLSTIHSINRVLFFVQATATSTWGAGFGMIISDLLVSLSYSSSSVRRLSLLLSARGGLALGQRNSVWRGFSQSI